MRLHIDNIAYQRKAEGAEIGGIKSRFTNPASIKDMTVEQIAAALTAGKTVQPGVCPFSERSRAAGKKGTVKEDFAKQTLFMIDIDNKRTDIPFETPAHVVAVLAKYNLEPAFMYRTFNSTPENERFRIGMLSSEEFTVKTERDRVSAGLVKLFQQSDPDCTNADRIFFGTDKGLIDEYTNFEDVCQKSDLLALADAVLMERLQMMDIGFQYSEPKYQKRKQMLEWYAMRWREEKNSPALIENKEGTAA